MRDEELPVNVELQEDVKQERKQKGLFHRPESRPLLYFVYFVLVLLVFSTIFSVIKVVAE